MKRLLVITTIFILLMTACTTNKTIRVGTGEDIKSIEQAISILKETNYKKATIVLCDESYYISNSIQIDSTINNLTIRGDKGVYPIIYGGIKIDSWEQCTLNGQEVLVADLSKFNISDWGDVIVQGKQTLLIHNNKVQTLARWPNNNMTKAGRTIGETKKYHARTERCYVETWFEYLDNHIDRWAVEEEPCIKGYFAWDWFDNYQRIDKIDTKRNIITTLPPYSQYGTIDNFHYYGLNLLCELDAPEEFYVSKREQKVYWMPPTSYSKDSSETMLTAYDINAIFELTNCNNIEINGITFRAGRNIAIATDGCDNINIQDCRVQGMGSDAVKILKSHDVLVDGLFVEQIGGIGVFVVGDSTERSRLQPSNITISNSIIEHNSLYKDTYTPAIKPSRVVGLTIKNCRLAHIPSSAFGFGSANEILIKHNLIHNVVKISGDQGAVDIYLDLTNRGIKFYQNYWKDIRNFKTEHGSAGIRLDDMISGVEIEGNIFENVGGAKFGGVQIHSGMDNKVKGNIFYNCPRAISMSPWDTEKWFRFYNNTPQQRLLKSVDIELFTKVYPELKNSTDSTKICVNYLYNNLAINCKELLAHTNPLATTHIPPQHENNNTHIVESDRPIDYYLDPKIQKEYIGNVIPVDSIGVLRNIWSK